MEVASLQFLYLRRGWTRAMNCKSSYRHLGRIRHCYNFVDLSVSCSLLKPIVRDNSHRQAGLIVHCSLIDLMDLPVVDDTIQ